MLGLVLGLSVPAYHERTTENAVVFDPVYPVLFGKLFIGLVLTGCRDVKSLQIYKVVQIINFAFSFHYGFYTCDSGSFSCQATA